MNVWQLQEAKAKLSEVLKKAVKFGPQMITIRGEITAVILAKEEYNNLVKPKESFIDFMRNSPMVGANLSIRRDKSKTRDIEL